MKTHRCILLTVFTLLTICLSSQIQASVIRLDFTFMQIGGGGSGVIPPNLQRTYEPFNGYIEFDDALFDLNSSDNYGLYKGIGGPNKVSMDFFGLELSSDSVEFNVSRNPATYSISTRTPVNFVLPYDGGVITQFRFDVTFSGVNLLSDNLLPGVPSYSGYNARVGGSGVATGYGTWDWGHSLAIQSITTTSLPEDNPDPIVKVPEPYTAYLLGLGIIGLGYSRRRSTHA